MVLRWVFCGVEAGLIDAGVADCGVAVGEVVEAGVVVGAGVVWACAAPLRSIAARRTFIFILFRYLG
jgi:hypothetical protein